MKVCGCRPHEGGAAHSGAGVRKPPRVETAGGVRGRTSDAMGISAPAVCCNVCFGIDREGDEPGRPIAIGGTGVALRRSNDTMGIQDGVGASQIIAGREPAKQKCSLAILSRGDLDHDVSILITAMDGAGR